MLSRNRLCAQEATRAVRCRVPLSGSAGATLRMLQPEQPLGSEGRQTLLILPPVVLTRGSGKRNQ
jgi:hypothetical protein